MLLTAVEARVLGSLMEKETTTPEAYPLSLNALVAACNQKTSRDPVLQLSEREVHTALRSLQSNDLTSMDHGSRVERYENRARTVFALRRDEAALLCLLLLRGPQTPGELRGRADRLFTFEDVGAVLAALQRMGESVSVDGAARRDPLIVALPRQAGSREQRYQHLLCGAPEHATAVAEAFSPVAALSQKSVPQQSEELAELTAMVQQLEARIADLEQALRSSGLLSAAPQ